jgi:phage host-nuclease inhibitor protein Gam
VDAETRAYLDQALGTFRDDVSREFGTLRQEVRDTAAETRRHFDVVAEHLRHDIRGIGEGVIALSEGVDRLGSGLRTEMNERFAATHAVVRVAFQEVRRDIEDLRTSL